MHDTVAIRNEITKLVNSLDGLFDQLHATQAKMRLTEAHMWAEQALVEQDYETAGTE